MKDPGLAKAAGNAAAVGTVVTCPCSPPEKAGGTFVADYKAKWNVDAGTYSDVAFDAANIFLAGIDAGNTTPEKMNTYLSTVNYKGIANTYKFTATGELDPAPSRCGRSSSTRLATRSPIRRSRPPDRARNSL